MSSVGLAVSRARCTSRFFSGALRASRAVVRRVSSRKICQSWRWSASFSKTAGVKRAVLRTASRWKTRS